jgi:hypothetical protein
MHTVTKNDDTMVYLYNNWGFCRIHSHDKNRKIYNVTHDLNILSVLNSCIYIYFVVMTAVMKLFPFYVVVLFIIKMCNEAHNLKILRNC